MIPSSWRRSLAAVILLVLGADWATKFWVRNRISLGDTHSLVEGWIALAHRENTGVAFGWLANAAPGLRLPLIAFASLLSAWLLFQLVRQSEERSVWLAAALIVAGAVGNFTDRLVDGRVTDFVLVHPFPYVWNVADAAITVGAALLLLSQLLPGGKEEPAPAGPASV